MSEVVSLQTHPERIAIESFDMEFERLYARSYKLIKTIPVDILYGTSYGKSDSESVGSFILRSAGVVEQTCGGITSNLWDDPFEWTLPETLSTSARVIEYLSEVEETRKHAFACFAGDADLLKKIATPFGEMRPLISLLLDTLVRALEFQGRALALLPVGSQGVLFDRHA
ncbi:MAG: hypothetical protein H0T77_04215 [Pyrinomonadaceae bacterium]|jgi:hypothetical protein|nr:hypothetical protein [Pyrinomonadaceae bacterium]